LFDAEAAKNRLYPLITWDDVIDKVQKGTPLPTHDNTPASSSK